MRHSRAPILNSLPPSFFSYHTYRWESGPGFGQVFEMRDKIRKRAARIWWGRTVWADACYAVVSLLLPIRLKTTGGGGGRSLMYSTRPRSAPALQSVSERKGKWECEPERARERDGEMQTLEEEEGETEDKLVRPPPHPPSLLPPPPTTTTTLPSLSGDSGLCARLQIDSDVLIYVLMIGLVCNLCSAMLQPHGGARSQKRACTRAGRGEKMMNAKIAPLRSKVEPAFLQRNNAAAEENHARSLQAVSRGGNPRQHVQRPGTEEQAPPSFFFFSIRSPQTALSLEYFIEDNY